jgi:hypothetical protein
MRDLYLIRGAFTMESSTPTLWINLIEHPILHGLFFCLHFSSLSLAFSLQAQFLFSPSRNVNSFERTICIMTYFFIMLTVLHSRQSVFHIINALLSICFIFKSR